MLFNRRAIADLAAREAETLRSWVDDNPQAKSKLRLEVKRTLPI